MGFAEQLLNWFDQCGRKDLPWQQQKTPYRVWLSEIMLQQTQVTTVIPYFLRFIARFPTLTKLAAAPLDEVLHLWAGLGYYSRARNLHRSAQMIAQQFSGKFPDNLATLQTLPGIGRSTAGAILALAFNQSVPILDGNVKRVMTRLHGIREWVGEKAIETRLWELATHYTPQQRIADYTQAIMDLGATLCTRSKPNCSHCPFTTECSAYQQNLTAVIPAKKPKTKLPVRHATTIVLLHDDKILLEKRPIPGIWGGLWSLPEITGEASAADLKKYCRLRFQLTIEAISFSPSFRHTFSHYHSQIYPAIVLIKNKPRKIMETETQIWYNLDQPPAIGLPAPIQTILRSLRECGSSNA